MLLIQMSPDRNCAPQVNATSVNPSDVDTAEGGGCKRGCGADVSGNVVSCKGSSNFSPGDAVWTLSSPAYQDYIVQPAARLSSRPKTLDHHHAGTLPEVGLTSFFSLMRTAAAPGTPLPSGSPWDTTTKYKNLTVVVTAGAGGTGMIGLQLAKAWGAKHIATATTGAAGEAFVRSLGATFVTDYKKEDIFDVLPDNSVDIVYDNYGAEHTADKAMRAIRPGGAYLMMPHGICYELKLQRPPCLAKHAKPGVTQLNFDTSPDFTNNMKTGLDRLAQLVDSAALMAPLDSTFAFEDIALAFNYSAGPGEGGVSAGHRGKISVVM